MGSMSAMNSINRVLERHSEALETDARAAPPGTRLVYKGVSLENNLYSISVTHEFENEAGEGVHLIGEPLDIDDLAERFPDCDIGY